MREKGISNPSMFIRFRFLYNPAAIGTDVADTEAVSSAIHHALSQIAYLFGFNAGPEHLNGQNLREAPHSILALLFFS